MKRVVIAVVFAVLLTPVAIVYGRAEGRSAVHAQQRQLAEIRAEVGDRIGRPVDTTYDSETHLICLLYPAQGVQFGHELCFDPQLRLVEALDRTRSPNQLASLRWDRAAATITMRRATMVAVLKRHPPANGFVR